MRFLSSIEYIVKILGHVPIMGKVACHWCMCDSVCVCVWWWVRLGGCCVCVHAHVRTCVCVCVGRGVSHALVGVQISHLRYQ